MHCPGIGTDTPDGLSMVEEIHIKKAAILAAMGCGDRRRHCLQLQKSRSKITIDPDHFTLSSTFGAGMRTGTAMANLRSDV
jgi:hypothetical protein